LDLKIVKQEISTDNIITQEVEVIDYDEAIIRAGGFGIYQVLLFWATATLGVYGDQIIYNFVYVSNPYKQLCQYPGEDTFKVCTREEICLHRGNPGFMTRPNTQDKNYIYALTGDFEEMNCWTDSKTAFLAQMWFFGFLAKVLAAPLLERYGHQNFLKRVLIPLNIISF
jgi:hypothetical protein